LTTVEANKNGRPAACSDAAHVSIPFAAASGVPAQHTKNGPLNLVFLPKHKTNTFPQRLSRKTCTNIVKYPSDRSPNKTMRRRRCLRRRAAAVPRRQACSAATEPLIGLRALQKMCFFAPQNDQPLPGVLRTPRKPEITSRCRNLRAAPSRAPDNKKKQTQT